MRQFYLIGYEEVVNTETGTISLEKKESHSFKFIQDLNEWMIEQGHKFDKIEIDMNRN